MPSRASAEQFVPDSADCLPPVGRRPKTWASRRRLDRKSTRLNSSHSQTSYAVFCLKKKNDSILIAPLYRSGRGPTVSPPWRWTPAVRQLPACCRVLRVVRLLSELPSHADPPAHPPS